MACKRKLAASDDESETPRKKKPGRPKKVKSEVTPPRKRKRKIVPRSERRKRSRMNSPSTETEPVVQEDLKEEIDDDNSFTPVKGRVKSKEKTSQEVVIRLAEQAKLPLDTTKRIIKQFDEDSTIPFLVRYRKEVIGHQTAEELRKIKINYDKVKEFIAKRNWVKDKLEERGLLNPETKANLEKLNSIIEIEHFYEQFKVKREDKVAKARSEGFDTPAWSILLGDTRVKLENHVPPGGTLKDVREGIIVILASIFSHDCNVLGELRDLQKTEKFRLISKLCVKLRTKKDMTQDEERKVSNFKSYFDFDVSTYNVKPHQVLAINRGVSQKVLTSKITLSDSVRHKLYNFCCRTWLFKGIKCSERTSIFKESFERAYSLRLSKFLERLVKSELDSIAEEASLQVFGDNLKWALLAPPSRGETVLAIDPGYRHGCKVAVAGPNGKLLQCTTLYLTSPDNTSCLRKLDYLLIDNEVTLIAIGNGKGRHEVEKIVTGIIKSKKTRVHRYIVVNEQGLSVYSCSPEAAEEFPTLDPNMIGAVSLARRALDPLCELVKVDPKHLGLGMYQHDINKKKLNSVLLDVVSECVSTVGVDVNTAPAKILSHIAGLSVKKAEAIVARRELEPFTSRLDIKSVKGIGAKTFEQCAGFIRILPASLPGVDPSDLNPLDVTDIHPEAYGPTNKIILAAGADLKQLGKAVFINAIKQWSSRIKLDKKAEELSLTPSQLENILKSLTQKMDFDCRLENSQPTYRTEMLSLSSLTAGQVITGRVDNVTQFGVFVDVGVERDGLIPMKYLPGEVKYGDTVEVKVVNILGDRLTLQLLKCL